MSALELLDTLSASGVRLWAEGGKLKLDAPRGAVTPELKERLAAHKPALLAALTAHTSEDFDEPGARPGRELMAEQVGCGECPDCGGAMKLQYREPEQYWCALCKLWFTDGVLQ
jgi:hypothetical protein